VHVVPTARQEDYFTSDRGGAAFCATSKFALQFSRRLSGHTERGEKKKEEKNLLLHGSTFPYAFLVNQATEASRASSWEEGKEKRKAILS